MASSPASGKNLNSNAGTCARGAGCRERDIDVPEAYVQARGHLGTGMIGGSVALLLKKYGLAAQVVVNLSRLRSVNFKTAQGHEGDR